MNLGARTVEINDNIPTQTRPSVIAVLVLLTCAAIATAHFGAQRLFKAQAVSVAESQHALYLRSLNQAIKQHQHLPLIIGENPLVADQVGRGASDGLNKMLEGFAEASRLEAIYVMNLAGEVVAASNYAKQNSFLGQNYGFRPYFQQAASGTHSDYFALGATTGRPGYFVAAPLRSNSGDIIGVTAIKLDISELQASWQDRGEDVLAVNSDGIIVMSSNRDWLYHTIATLDETRRAQITDSRQFGLQDIPALTWQPQANGRVTFGGAGYFITSGDTDLVDWTVHYLTSVAYVQRQTWLATAILGAFITVLIAISVFLRSLRIQAALNVSQVQRQALEDTNQRLVTAQEALARNAKLAALGQLAASVTHELGQPISALKNHLFAAEIGDEIRSPDTLTNLRRLTDRMEGITKQLRFFARQSGDEWDSADMSTVVAEALHLVRHDLDAQAVELEWTSPQDRLEVQGNQLQLEQAMVNLLRNALQAVRDADPARIAVTCTRGQNRVRVSVSDTGTGLNGASLNTLKEPFFSTRSSGEGMGLGLAITSEIITAHGGHLEAQDAADGGAVFTLTLPLKEPGT